MSDEIDRASDVEQIQRDSAIANARYSKTTIVSTGECLQCEAELSDGRRWCDFDCCELWSARNPGA